MFAKNYTKLQLAEWNGFLILEIFWWGFREFYGTMLVNNYKSCTYYVFIIFFIKSSTHLYVSFNIFEKNI